MVELDDFLFRKQIKGPVLGHGLELAETGDPAADGPEVRQHAAEPAGVDEIGTRPLRFLADGFLSLLFRADKQHGLAFRRELPHEHIRFFQLADGLLQVDDIDAVALGKNVGGHLGVPAPGLMSEMDARLEQLFHGYDCHNAKSSFGFTLCGSCAPNQIFDGISANRRQRHPAELHSRMCFAAIVYHGFRCLASFAGIFGSFTPNKNESTPVLGRIDDNPLSSPENSA